MTNREKVTSYTLCSFSLLSIEGKERMGVRPRVWSVSPEGKKAFDLISVKPLKKLFCHSCMCGTHRYVLHTSSNFCELSVNKVSAKHKHSQGPQVYKIKQEVHSISWHLKYCFSMTWKIFGFFSQIQRGKFWMKFKFEKSYKWHTITVMTYSVWLGFEHESLLFKVHPLNYLLYWLCIQLTLK